MTTPTLRDLTAGPALRRLELTVTRRMDGMLHGEHLGLVPGPGSEPAEAREYQPGDDARRMDWNLTARTDQPHVRDLVADRELTTWAVVDTTASMDFGTGTVEKRDLAVAAVAAVGFLTARTGNRLGAQVVTEHGIRQLPARSGRSHLYAVLKNLHRVPRTPPGTTGPALADGLATLARTVTRRGLVVVVSDFLDGSGPDAGQPPWGRPLRLLAARHQVLAVEVVDPRELTLPDVGVLTVVDPESGRRGEVPTASARLRERYAAAAATQRGHIRETLRRAGADHLRLRTDRDWTRDIVRHVLTARLLAGAARRKGRPG